jgi:hypothetical protein
MISILSINNLYSAQYNRNFGQKRPAHTQNNKTCYIDQIIHSYLNLISLLIILYINSHKLEYK